MFPPLSPVGEQKGGGAAADAPLFAPPPFPWKGPRPPLGVEQHPQSAQRPLPPPLLGAPPPPLNRGVPGGGGRAPFRGGPTMPPPPSSSLGTPPPRHPSAFLFLLFLFVGDPRRRGGAAGRSATRGGGRRWGGTPPSHPDSRSPGVGVAARGAVSCPPPSAAPPRVTPELPGRQRLLHGCGGGAEKGAFSSNYGAPGAATTPPWDPPQSQRPPDPPRDSPPPQVPVTPRTPKDPRPVPR